MASLVPNVIEIGKVLGILTLSSGSIYKNVHMDKPANLQSLIIINDCSLMKEKKKYLSKKLKGASVNPFWPNFFYLKAENRKHYRLLMFFTLTFSPASRIFPQLSQ